jgi:hypothetical protein
MKRTGVVAQLALAICAGAAHGQSTVGWPETVDRLNQQRSQAVACLELLKDSGDAAAIRKGRFIYKSAKSFSDGVISGFTVALVEGYKPDKLPPLQAHLELAGKGLKDVCNAAVARGSGRGRLEGYCRRPRQGRRRAGCHHAQRLGEDAMGSPRRTKQA